MYKKEDMQQSNGEQKNVTYSPTKDKIQIEHLKFEKRLKITEVDARAAAVLRGGIFSNDPATKNVHVLEHADYQLGEMSKRQAEIKDIEQKLADAEKRLKSHGNK